MCAKGRPKRGCRKYKSIHNNRELTLYVCTDRPKRDCKKHIYDTELCMC